MKNKLLLIVLSIFLSSCLNGKYDVGKKDAKVWVYMEIETILKKDTSQNYIYGQIKKSILDEMRNNPKASGIFFVDNTRYINDDDLLEIYADEKDTGELAFRLEDIKTLDVLKKDPIRTFDKEQLHESSIKYLILKRSEVNSKN